MVEATPANMKKYWRNSYEDFVGEEKIIIHPQNPITYSFETGEQYSANPNDYTFWVDENEAITDSMGNSMVLVFEQKKFVEADEFFKKYVVRRS